MGIVLNEEDFCKRKDANSYERGFLLILQANHKAALYLNCFLYILHRMRKIKRLQRNPRLRKRSPISLFLVFHMFHHDRNTIITAQEKYLPVSVCASLQDLNQKKGKCILISRTVVFSPRYALESLVVLYKNTNVRVLLLTNISDIQI